MCKACYHYESIKKALFDDHVPEVNYKLIDEVVNHNNIEFWIGVYLNAYV